MDRRTLLKSAAALSAAAMTTAPALATMPAEAAVLPIAAAPVKLSPYSDYVWEWFVSNDGETYYEAFSTKEAAIEYAQRSEYSLVAECVQQDFRLDVDGGWLLDHINDNNMELIGEGDGITCSQQQEQDLEKMVRRAIEAWAVKHQIDLTAWSFASIQNETYVPETGAVSNGER